MKTLSFLLIWLFYVHEVEGQNAYRIQESDDFKYSVEIPEVQELMFVIFAITEKGMSDTLLIHHNSDYYQRVIKHFQKFREDRIVKSIGKEMAKSYNQLRMDASNYIFDLHGNLIKSEKHHNLSWGKHDYIKEYQSELQTFCVKSDFRSFYRSNQSYYDSLIQLWELQGALTEQHVWLERNFPLHFSSYRIVFSPLSYGQHATNASLNDVVIFVSGPSEDSNLTQPLLEARDSRMLFTEIDHNYVNPISDLYSKEIRRAFRNRAKWANGKFSGSYNTEYALFNEYMTWSVFILFAMDRYSAEDFYAIKSNLEIFMIEYRGFTNFRWFNDAMIELYKNKGKDANISDLFPKILKLCEGK